MLKIPVILSVMLSAITLSLFLPAVLHTDVFTAQAQVNNQDPNIVVDTAPDSSISYALLQRAKTSWPWYVTRASGLIAGLLLFVLMLSGVGFITGHSFKFLEPITAWATHRAMGISLASTVFLHIFSLYFDEFVNFDFKDLFVPFASEYRPIELFGYPVGSFYVALGVFAFYIFIIIVLTSLLWINKKPRTWKAIHILSYIGAVFVFIHALYLGTDLAQGTLRWIWIVIGIFTLLAIVTRLWRVKTV